MSNPDQNPPEAADTELSPEARTMLGKARRSFAVSMGILLLGFMAIGVALVYRVMRDAPPPTMAASVSVPAGAEVISALSVNGTVQVTYRAGANVVLAVFDGKTGAPGQSVEIKAE